MIGPAQIRAARGLLDVNQTKLSEWASISVATLKRIEGSSEIRGAADTLWKIQQALESAGVEFIPEEAGRGPGVRLKQAGNSALARSKKPSSQSQTTPPSRQAARGSATPSSSTGSPFVALRFS